MTMGNNHCGCRRRRGGYGCLESVNRRCRWENYPYYNGCCPDVNGAYDCDTEDDNRCRWNCDENGAHCRCRKLCRWVCEDREDAGDQDDNCEDRGCKRRCRPRNCCGMFMATLPIAVAANGVVPLVSAMGCDFRDYFEINSGMITVCRRGIYLATYTVRLPEAETVESMFTLNVNDASQSSAIMMVGGAGPNCFTAQSLIDVCDRATVTLRSSEAVNITNPSVQPLVTLSLTEARPLPPSIFRRRF